MNEEQLNALIANLWVKYATNDNRGGDAAVHYHAFKLAIERATYAAIMIQGTRTRGLDYCEVP
jgi:hypothetical protein